MRRILIACILFCIASPTPVLAKSVDERVVDLENRVNSIQQTYLTNNADMARAISRSESIQADFDAVKGAVEANGHLLDSQRQELMRMIRDLEQRVQAIEDRMQIFATQINQAIGKVNPAAAEEGKIYQSGLDKAERGEYLNAAADFQTFLKKYPKSSFAASAQYWTAECFYSMKDYKRAIKEYQLYIQTYPKHEKVASALLKQGNSFYELGMIEESKPFYDKVIKEYPSSSEAAQATAKMQRLGQKQAPGQSGQSVARPVPGASQPVVPSAGSYPTQTIQEQRSKYSEPAPSADAPKQTQPGAPAQKRDQRLNEF